MKAIAASPRLQYSSVHIVTGIELLFSGAILYIHVRLCLWSNPPLPLPFFESHEEKRENLAPQRNIIERHYAKCANPRRIWKTRSATTRKCLPLFAETPSLPLRRVSPYFLRMFRTEPPVEISHGLLECPSQSERKAGCPLLFSSSKRKHSERNHATNPICPKITPITFCEKSFRKQPGNAKRGNCVECTSGIKRSRQTKASAMGRLKIMVYRC